MGEQVQTEDKTQAAKKQDELILVVNRDRLFSQGAWHGLKQDGLPEYIACIEQFGEFKWRSTMEYDPHYKQIIPYLIFYHENRFFLMQRKGTASEQRLKNKFSLGIGGHMRQDDMQGKSIFDWAQREFFEEVSYHGNLTISTLGLLNDDSNNVGEVHLGLVLLLHGDSPEIAVKSELKRGQLLSLADCKTYISEMESWSQLVFSVLEADVIK